MPVEGLERREPSPTVAIINSQTAKGAQKGDFTRSFGGLPEVDGAETPAVVAKAAGVCPRKVRSISARSQRPLGSRCGARNSYNS